MWPACQWVVPAPWLRGVAVATRAMVVANRVVVAKEVFILVGFGGIELGEGVDDGQVFGRRKQKKV